MVEVLLRNSRVQDRACRVFCLGSRRLCEIEEDDDDWDEDEDDEGRRFRTGDFKTVNDDDEASDLDEDLVDEGSDYI